MDHDSYPHGVPSWIDIGTPDMEGTVAFYSGLFGWECPEGTEDTGFYRVCTLGGRTVAGIGPKQDPNMPTVWTTYVNVDSADDIAKKVADAGGMVFMPPMDVMDAGRMAIFADPTGAVFGVWQPGQHPGAQVTQEPGSLTWNELVTTDTAAAATFYTAVFGWDAAVQNPDGPMVYTEWKVNGESVGGMMAKSPDMPAEMPSNWVVYFASGDTDASVAKAKELGASVILEPMDIEPGRMAVLVDPQGAVFSLLQMKQ